MLTVTRFAVPPAVTITKLTLFVDATMFSPLTKLVVVAPVPVAHERFDESMFVGLPSSFCNWIEGVPASDWHHTLLIVKP